MSPITPAPTDKPGDDPIDWINLQDKSWSILREEATPKDPKKRRGIAVTYTGFLPSEDNCLNAINDEKGRHYRKWNKTRWRWSPRMSRILKCSRQACKVKEEEISWVYDKSKYLPYGESCRIEVFGDLGYRRNESPRNKNWSLSQYPQTSW